MKGLVTEVVICTTRFPPGVWAPQVAKLSERAAYVPEGEPASDFEQWWEECLQLK